MGSFVVPDVHYLGCTGIDWPGLEGYLLASGNQDFIETARAAKGQGLSDGEILCSFYAKLCYKSLTLGQNANISRLRDIPDNLRGCFDQGHGSVFEHCQLNFVARNVSRILCYEPATEVFTDGGWCGVAALNVGQNVLALDTVSGLAKWSPVLSVHQFPYEGEMLAWSNSQMLAPLVTPDHLLWLAWNDLRRARHLSAAENVRRYGEKVPFSEAFGKRFVIRKDVPWLERGADEEIDIGGRVYRTEDLFSWLGWMATDGGFCKDRAAKCTIVQSKLDGVAIIRCLMDQLFPGRWRMYGPYDDTKAIQFIINDRCLADFAREHLGADKATRHFSRWLLDAGTDNLRAFAKAAVAGDGHVHEKNGHTCLYCPSEHAAGQYQVIFSMLGMPANVRVDDRVGAGHEVGGKTVFQTRPSYVVDVSRRGGGTLVRVRDQFRQRYSGPVYCPRTAEGVVYVRKAGHAFWSGNTHELVRHRAGAAFSQTSGRYVRGDSLDIVLDPILEPVRERVARLQGVMEQEYRAMVKEMGLDTATDFAWKKKVTSALRRLLPNGQSNEIGFCLAADTKVWLGGRSAGGHWYANKRTIAEVYQNWHYGCERVVHQGHSGVAYNAEIGRFRAGGQRNGKHVHLGYFDTKDQGEKAYRDWAASIPTVTVKRLRQCRRLQLRVLDEGTNLFVPGRVRDVYQSGVKELVELRTETGRRLRCSRDHRILTIDGWVCAGELRARDRVAISGLRAIHADRAIPKRLRQGIGLWATQQRELLIRMVDACWVCGVVLPRKKLILDHVVPVAADLARALDPANLRPICTACNRIKVAGEAKLARRANAAGSKWVRLAETPVVCDEGMTYDLAVDGPYHNFVADGFIVHNSLNLRSLRHVVQLRTSRHAEWEIRVLFGQVYRLVKSKHPLVFYGAVEEEVDGLPEVSGMKMQPYELKEG